MSIPTYLPSSCIPLTDKYVYITNDFRISHRGYFAEFIKNKTCLCQVKSEDYHNKRKKGVLIKFTTKILRNGATCI